jgi:hypothetical protein
MRTNFQLNEKWDEAGTSQILHTKPFQRQVIRKLLVMFPILLFLYKFYSSSFLITFSSFMSSFSHFSRSFYSLVSFTVSSILFIMLIILLNVSHSLSPSSSFLQIPPIIYCSFPPPIYSPPRSAPFPMLIFCLTFIPLVLLSSCEHSCRFKV